MAMRNKAEKIRFIDDLARVAGGAFQSLGGLREQVKGLMTGLLADMDLVSRDEFERVEALAQKAREKQGELEKRLAALEKKSRPSSGAGKGKKKK